MGGGGGECVSVVGWGGLGVLVLRFIWCGWGRRGWEWRSGLSRGRVMFSGVFVDNLHKIQVYILYFL